MGWCFTFEGSFDLMTNPNEPAFPIQLTATDAFGRSSYPGMTLREWCAGQAMNGLWHCVCIDLDNDVFRKAVEGIAKVAVQAADALIAELSKGETTVGE